ncbi:MAG: MerR family transcriptional regulator [Alphaproteobacteria bacterium]
MVINKSTSAFRTIRELASEIGVATHVLRFWETKFPQIQPMKRTGGRRFYRPDDVELIKLIQDLLHNKRMTIEGVQKVFGNKKIKAILGQEIQKDFFNIEEEETEVTHNDDNKYKELLISILKDLEDLKNSI